MVLSKGIPAKVFLVGEYAALLGLRAWLWTFPDAHFRLEMATKEDVAFPFHPQSPAGKLWTTFAADQPWVGGTWKKPFEWGGFGASTAEFLAVAQALGLKLTDHELWSAYRELQGGRIRPSGADLIAQRHGGLVAIQSGERVAEVEDFLSPNLVVFATPDRKTLTHKHLESLSNLPSPSTFEPLIEQTTSAMERSDLSALATALRAYADLLNRLGFEEAATYRDRQKVLNWPGVLGAKGSGAMQSDSLLVVVDRHADRSAIVEQGRALGWFPVWVGGPV